MLKKGVLALALVIGMPVYAAEHWIDVAFLNSTNSSISGSRQYFVKRNEGTYCS